MLHSHAPRDAASGAASSASSLPGHTALEALRFDAGVIHHQLRRIAADAACGATPRVDELDRVAATVHELHERILAIHSEEASVALGDVVAARRSIHRSLTIVREVADDVRSA